MKKTNYQCQVDVDVDDDDDDDDHDDDDDDDVDDDDDDCCCCCHPCCSWWRLQFTILRLHYNHKLYLPIIAMFQGSKTRQDDVNWLLQGQI